MYQTWEKDDKVFPEDEVGDFEDIVGVCISIQHVYITHLTCRGLSDEELGRVDCIYVWINLWSTTSWPVITATKNVPYYQLFYVTKAPDAFL